MVDGFREAKGRNVSGVTCQKNLMLCKDQQKEVQKASRG